MPADNEVTRGDGNALTPTLSPRGAKIHPQTEPEPFGPDSSGGRGPGGSDGALCTQTRTQVAHSEIF